MFHLVVENKTHILFEEWYPTQKEAVAVAQKYMSDTVRVTVFNEIGRVLLDDNAGAVMI